GRELPHPSGQPRRRPWHSRGERAGRRRTHHADQQHSGDGSPEGNLEAIDEGQDIGLTPYERRQGAGGARQSGFGPGTMLEEPSLQVAQGVNALAVASRYVQADQI